MKIFKSNRVLFGMIAFISLLVIQILLGKDSFSNVLMVGGGYVFTALFSYFSGLG